MAVAVIPARGGSKRLPRKNIRPFGGKPMLVHSIDVARRVPAIGRILVSTDDPAAARIAEDAGAEVVVRPAELASDHATTASAIRHALLSVFGPEAMPAAVVTLQPNCPLRTPGLVADALRRFEQEGADSVISVTQSHHKLGTIEGGTFTPRYRTGMRSQDMAAEYYENGVVYVSSTKMVVEKEDLFGARIVPVVIDPLYALGDIDTEFDFRLAEFLFYAYRAEFGKDAAESGRFVAADSSRPGRAGEAEREDGSWKSFG
jgi:N-acylneuraminate cytidylyltransferase